MGVPVLQRLLSRRRRFRRDPVSACGLERGRPGGEGGDEKEKKPKGTLSDQRNPRTGYTPGEAEGIIRQYMDEITAPLTNRYHTPPVNKKDW